MADDDWWPMQILIKCPNLNCEADEKIFFEKEVAFRIDYSEFAHEYVFS